MMQVPFYTFRDFPNGLLTEVQEALIKELHRNQLILGPSVKAFEKSFGQYLGVSNVIGVGNGYDALVLCLRSLGIGKGDEVVVPANGFIATINAVHQVGAMPILAEPDLKTYNITASSVLPTLSSRTKIILPIHLYGQSCELDELLQLCKDFNLELIEDLAQAQGATYKGKRVGAFGKVNATSFYPTKNLGATGDAGAVITQDSSLGEWIRSYHNYGQIRRYEYVEVGINSRLDSLQAAVLSVKLMYLDQSNQDRRRLASNYERAFREIGDLILPVVSKTGLDHVYHLYVVRTKHRDLLQNFLHKKGISTLIHYPIPPHLQPAFQYLGHRKGDFPISEELANTSLSLPLFPGMTELEQEYVIEQVQQFFA